MTTNGNNAVVTPINITSMVVEIEAEVRKTWDNPGPSDALDILVKAMAVVGHFKDVSGADKKRIVLEVVDRVLLDKVDGLLKTILPPTIDYLIQVEKGKLVFNEELKCKTWFSCCS